MKTSSVGKSVKRSTAMNCLLVNQLATPGLGSLMGRRFIEGAVQLSLAVGGFICVIAWFVLLIVKLYRETAGYAPMSDYSWTGKVGAILFISSWVLAWFTSLSLLRESRTAESLPPVQSLPPKLDGN